MNPEPAATLHGGRRGPIGHLLKGGDELGSAIRIAAVVRRVHPNEQVEGPEHLRPSEGVAQKDRVAGRHVRRGNLGRIAQIPAVFRHLDSGIGERGAAEGSQIDSDHPVLDGAERPGHPGRRFHLAAMTLAIAKGQGIAGKAFAACERQGGGGIQSAAQ